MEDKDHLIKHGSILFIAAIMSGACNLGFQIAMIRMLGPADFRIVFSLIGGLFMVINNPAGTLQTVITKYISSFKVKKELGKISYLIIRGLIRLAEALIVFLAIFILLSKPIANYQRLNSAVPVMIMGPILCLALLAPINFGALQGLERFTAFGFLQTLGAFTRIISGVFLVYIGFGVNGALLASLFSGILMLGLSWWALRDVWSFKPRDKNIGRKNIFKYSIPVAISYACFSFVAYMDPFIVNHYFKPLEAGYYSIASMLGKAFLYAPMTFGGAMFPKVVKLYEQGKKTTHLLFKTLFYSGIICIAGLLICFLFTKPLIYILMNKKDLNEELFIVMIPLLRYIGFVFMVYGFACIVINYFLARHWTKFLPFLIIGTVLWVLLLMLFHNSLFQVLTVLLIAGIFIFLCGIWGKIYEYIGKEFRKYCKKS